MIDYFIVYNQEIIPLDQARLSPGQAGLLLGWGVFTTLRLYQGIPFEFQRHWERMTHDAARLRMRLPDGMEETRERVIRLAQRNHRDAGMARVSFVRNAGGAWAGEPLDRPADLLAFTQPLPSWPESYRLSIAPAAVFSAGAFAGAKMLSWAPNSCIMDAARAEGFDDAILLNEHGHIVECTSANIFLVQQGAIATPPLASGCLPGVTREILLSVVASAGIQIHEKTIMPDDLDRAEEVFISSTTREVGGVREIGDRWKFAAPGKITTAAAKAFAEYAVRAEH